MYSTVSRFTGLSGIDTASMVEQLMKAESYKYNRLLKANMKTQYQQEAYQKVGNSLLDVQKSKFNMLSSGSFRSAATYSGVSGTLTSGAGTASSSANVKVLSGAASGKYDFTVDQLATTNKITAKPVNQGVASAAEAVDFDGLASLENGGTINLTINSTSREISLSKEEIDSINGNVAYTEQEKLQALRDVLNEKVAAAFGTTGKAAFSTADGKLKLEATTGNTAKMTDTGKTGLMGNLGFNTVSTTTGKSSGSTTTGGSVTAGNGFDIANLANITESTKISLNINGSSKNLTFSAEDVEQLSSGTMTEDDFVNMLNSKIDETFGDGASSKANFSLENGSISLNAGKGHSASINKTEVKEGVMSGMEVLGFDPNESKSTATTVPPTSIGDMFGVTEDLAFQINGKSFTFTADTSLDSFISQINSSGAGVQATYSETAGTFALESKISGIANEIKFDAAGEDFFLNGGGFTSVETRDATDATITLNGTQITRESNNFTVDGMSFQLNSVSEGTETITVNKDYSEIAKTLKDFVETYNSMLKSIYDETSTSRPVSSTGTVYEPLTDEERSAMSESQLKEWDEKAKQGLLKNDSTLAAVEESLRTAMSTPVKLADGTSLMLSDFGISLGDWSTKGVLVIDEDAMNKGLEQYGDKVGEFMTASGGGSYGSKGIAERVNTALNDAVGSNGSITRLVGLSSSPYYTANNDYKTKIADNAKSIAEMLTYLQRKEDQYYTQFSAMEAAITESNNQMAAIQGLFA